MVQILGSETQYSLRYAVQVYSLNFLGVSVDELYIAVISIERRLIVTAEQQEQTKSSKKDLWHFMPYWTNSHW